MPADGGQRSAVKGEPERGLLDSDCLQLMPAEQHVSKRTVAGCLAQGIAGKMLASPVAAALHVHIPALSLILMLQVKHQEGGSDIALLDLPAFF